MGATSDPNLVAARILNASRVAQAADDTDVVDWDKSDYAIIVFQLDEAKGPWDTDYECRWRDVTDVGSFASLGAATEVAYGPGTVLTDGGAVLIGEKACTNTPAGSSWQNGLEIDGSVVSNTINLLDEYYTELHFVIDLSNADDSHEYEFEIYDNSNTTSVGTALCTLTIADPPYTPVGVVIDADYEGGTFEGDSQTGTPVVTAGGLASTSYLLACAVSQTEDYETFDIATPIRSNVFRARFYMDPNSITSQDSDVFLAYFKNSTGDEIACVKMDYSSGFRIHLELIDDGATGNDTSDYSISDDEHYIEILVKRATSAVASDGSGQLWIDGVSKETLTSIDNYDLFDQLAEIDFGNRYYAGTETGDDVFVDEFIVRDDDTEIGALGGAYILDCVYGTFALTGQATNLEYGRVLDVVYDSFALTGQVTNLEYGRVLEVVYNTFALTGQTIEFLYSQVLDIDFGAFALTGQDVNLLYKLILDVDYGAFVFTGQAVGLQKGRTLDVGQGSFALSGQVVDLLYKRLLDAAYGSFVLTGQAVDFQKGRTLTADYGSFALTGQVVDLLYKRILEVIQGSFTLSGQIVDLLHKRSLDVSQGSFTLNGQAVDFQLGVSLICDYGSFALTGQIVDFPYNQVLAVSQGSFILSGQAVDLIVVGAKVLVCDYGSFNLTGQAVNLEWGHLIGLSQGSFVLNGQTVDFYVGIAMTCDYDSFALTGQTIDFLHSQALIADQGSFLLSGQTTDLLYKRIVELAQGSFTLTGQDVDFIRNIYLALDQGAFTLNGQDVTFLAALILPVDQGSFVLNGQDVTLTVGVLIAVYGNVALLDMLLEDVNLGSILLNDVLLAKASTIASDKQILLLGDVTLEDGRIP